MNTEQNYGVSPTPASQVEPADSSTTSTVDSDRSSAFVSPPRQSPPSLHLNYGSNGPGDSDAMIVFRALMEYRQDRVKWLVKYVVASPGSAGDSDSGSMLAEIVAIDQLLTDIAQGFEVAVNQLTDRLTYDENRANYVSPEDRDDQVNEQWVRDIRAFLS